MLRESRELMRAISDALTRMDELGALDLEQASRLNDQLSAVITEINRRLHLAYEWLQKGHRSLAVEECERKPPLLQLVSLFDRPEFVRWRELVDTCGMDPPPRPATDLAEELVQAYAAEQALAPLLRKFRRQNLERAPLKERLATLRQLCGRDPEVVEYIGDLEAFEAERLAEMEQELFQAVRAGDARVLEQLQQELSGELWLHPKADSLLNMVRSALRRLLVGQVEELVQLETALQRAWQEQDLDGARAALRRWQELSELAHLDGSHPLRRQAQKVLHWVEGEEAALQLERALEDGAPPEELNRLWQVAIRYRRELPVPLRRRLDRRLAAYKRMRRARSVRRAVGCATATLLVMIVVASLYWAWTRQRRVEDCYSLMQALLEKQEWEEVIQKAQQFERNHGNVPEKLASLVHEAKLRLSQEDARVEQFVRIRRRIEGLLEQHSRKALGKAETELTTLQEIVQRIPRRATRERLTRECDTMRRLVDEAKSRI